jgi:hypothetical protein
LPVDPHTPRPTGTLSTRAPRVGDTFSLQGRDYEVTGVSSYNAGDYQVTEWCCEQSDRECYLLRETKPGTPPKWFFTRWIEAKGVTQPGGAPLPRLSGREAAPQPPKTLLSGGDLFTHAETTDGVHEEDGERARKITWDFWNAGRTRNVAIELWEDGALDCYTGAYIRPEELSFTGRASGEGLFGSGISPFTRFFIFVPLCYLLLMIVLGQPFDECLTSSAFVAAVCVLVTLGGGAETGTAAVAVLAAAAGLSALYVFFPPLSTTFGLMGLFGTPLALTAWLRTRQLERDAARFLAVMGSWLPAAAVGTWHYFWHAPGPRTLTQLLLAWTPALVGAAAALAAAAAWMDQDAARDGA